MLQANCKGNCSLQGKRKMTHRPPLRHTTGGCPDLCIMKQQRLLVAPPRPPPLSSVPFLGRILAHTGLLPAVYVGGPVPSSGRRDNDRYVSFIIF